MGMNRIIGQDGEADGVGHGPEDTGVIKHVTTSGEVFVFRFTPDYRTELLRTLGRMAVNPDLNFGWHDVAIVSSRVRDEGNVPNDTVTIADLDGLKRK